MTTRSVYAHPTINQLAKYLFAAVSNDSGSAEAASDDGARTAAMKAPVDKYTADLPNVNTRRAASLTVAITGSTGSLGTHILEILLNDPSVRKVYCLNRSDDAQGRQEKAFAACGRTYDLADTARTEFLTTNLNDPQFGLDKQTFRTLRDSVDVLIHNA